MKIPENETRIAGVSLITLLGGGGGQVTPSTKGGFSPRSQPFKIEWNNTR